MSSRAPVPIGRYLLFKSLKKGGMARVFLGFDKDDPARLLAVKTLLPKLGDQRLYREMFASEGKVGVRLVHPNVVRTVEHGEDRGTAYIAMDFIFGFDLSTVLRRMRKQNQRIPLPLAVGLARDVCSGLAYAHELCDESGQPLDIVNRDVSPGNVMVGFDGHVKLIDFGIAQTTIDVKSQIGSIKGKISYMAPEQVRGLPVDHRVDLFSLGTVLYEMLTGVQIFHDEGDFATMERVRRAEAPPPSTHNPTVDPQLDALVARAMAREAHERYQSAREMLADLDAWLVAHGGQVSAAAWAELMRAQFDRQIDEMRDEIEAARQAALGAEQGTPLPAGAPARFIPEEALVDINAAPEPPAPEKAPAPPAPRGQAWLAAAVTLAIVGGAVAWALMRA